LIAACPLLTPSGLRHAIRENGIIYGIISAIMLCITDGIVKPTAKLTVASITYTHAAILTMTMRRSRFTRQVKMLIPSDRGCPQSNRDGKWRSR
jgi:hypothetical protein